MAETALDIIKRTFAYYGLTDARLLGEIETLWRGQSITASTPIDEIGVLLQDNPAFLERFPANKALRDTGKRQLGITEYLKLESTYKNVLQSAGMPAGFYDAPEDFSRFIEGDVSPDELSARVQQGYQAVRQADPQVVEEFRRLYGVSEGDLAAYFIDPQRARPTFDRYEAERQARSAAISAQAQQQAQMELTRQEAETLARSGVSVEGSAEGFGALAQQQGLFEAQMAGEEAVSRQEQLGLIQGSAQAQQRIATRRRRRQAQFEQGGQVALGTVGQ